MEEDSGYVCSLTPASLKIATAELGESEKERLNAVAAFREWIQQQPHINSPTDTNWLLMFLRTAKFSQLRARELLTGYLTCKSDVAPEWYNNCDTADPKLQAFFECGYMVPLPGYDPQGRKVVFVQEGALETDGKRYGADDVLKGCFAFALHMLQDENIQVNGLVYVSDFSNYSILHQNMFSMDVIKKSMKCWMKNYPARYKGFYMYNHGPLVEAMMTLIRPLLSAKMKTRTHMIGSNLEKLYKLFPKSMIPKEYLPDDYTGPTVGSVREITEKWQAVFKTPEVRERAKYLSDPKWGIDTKKKPVEVENASFRKLNID